MTKSPVTVAPGETLRTAIELMKAGGFRRMPVVERGRLVGIVSERDLRVASGLPRIPHGPMDEHYLLDHVTIREIMAREILTVSPETMVASAARLMLEHRIGGIPVMKGESLVGIITESDLLRCFVGLLEGSMGPESSEAEAAGSEVPIESEAGFVAEASE
ncbi:MAG: CBS domain-containing protein [Anaerolineae bacterium]